MYLAFIELEWREQGGGCHGSHTVFRRIIAIHPEDLSRGSGLLTSFHDVCHDLDASAFSTPWWIAINSIVHRSPKPGKKIKLLLVGNRTLVKVYELVVLAVGQQVRNNSPVIPS